MQLLLLSVSYLIERGFEHPLVISAIWNESPVRVTQIVTAAVGLGHIVADPGVQLLERARAHQLSKLALPLALLAGLVQGVRLRGQGIGMNVNIIESMILVSRLLCRPQTLMQVPRLACVPLGIAIAWVCVHRLQWVDLSLRLSIHGSVPSTS